MFFFSRVNPWIAMAIVVGVVLAVGFNADGLLRWLSFGAVILYVLAFLYDEFWS